MSRRGTFFLVAWVLLVPFPAAAQSEPAGVDPVVREIAGVKRSLDRLASLVEKALARQEVALHLQRIEVKERRMAPLRAELRKVESQVLDARQQVEQLTTMLESQRDALQEEIQAGTDAPNSDTRRMIEDLERVIPLETARADDLESRRQRLEDELADAEEEIEDLDDRIDELLGESGR